MDGKNKNVPNTIFQDVHSCPVSGLLQMDMEKLNLIISEILTDLNKRKVSYSLLWLLSLIEYVQNNCVYAMHIMSLL